MSPLLGVESTLLKFKEDQVTFSIPDDGTVVTKEGWRITPFTNPTVSGTETSLYCTDSQCDLSNIANAVKYEH